MRSWLQQALSHLWIKHEDDEPNRGAPVILRPKEEAKALLATLDNIANAAVDPIEHRER